LGSQHFTSQQGPEDLGSWDPRDPRTWDPARDPRTWDPRTWDPRTWVNTYGTVVQCTVLDFPGLDIFEESPGSEKWFNLTQSTSDNAPN
jgi:hypothetical protein